MNTTDELVILGSSQKQNKKWVKVDDRTTIEIPFDCSNAEAIQRRDRIFRMINGVPKTDSSSWPKRTDKEIVEGLEELLRMHL